MQLTNLPLGPVGTSARGVYRTSVNGNDPRLVAFLTENTTTTLVDRVADAARFVQASQKSLAIMAQT